MDIDPDLKKDIPIWEKKAMGTQWPGIVVSYPHKDNDEETDKYHVEKTGFGQIKITQEKLLGGVFPIYETSPEKVGIPNKLLKFTQTIKPDGCPKGTRKHNGMCIPYKKRGKR